jgi:hypothetical protein
MLEKLNEAIEILDSSSVAKDVVEFVKEATLKSWRVRELRNQTSEYSISIFGYAARVKNRELVKVERR